MMFTLILEVTVPKRHPLQIIMIIIILIIVIVIGKKSHIMKMNLLIRIIISLVIKTLCKIILLAIIMID
ncbi:hypothetical protein H8356DRAFT_1652702 [Neocallimastix lanati (nom. inval.)]|nr:hypothetical protein H8356DRAFT_1652702 [Neocallimastix sp. JGI-2020a]